MLNIFMMNKTVRQSQTNNQTKETKFTDLIPAKIETNQTKLITKAVENLEMDSEENNKADSTEKDVQSGGEGEPTAKDVDNEEQRAYDKKED